MMIVRLGFLPLTWEVQIVFLAPGFGLALPWYWRNEPVDWQSLSP